MFSCKSLTLSLLAAAAFASSAAGHAQTADSPMPPAFLRAIAPMVPRATATDRVVTTDHKGVFNGQTVPYRAIVTELPLTNAEGKKAAVVVTYGYVAQGRAASVKRPVLFIFNGGPGASSSPLHMQAFGPRRIVGKGDAAHLEANPYSLLDIADLVFIDPVGTGASMPVEGADTDGFFGVGGDARAVSTVVGDWLRRNGRETSPYLLVGESYGTARALAILNEDMKAKTRLPDGVVLLSLSLGWTDAPVLSELVTLPTYSAVAWYHGAIDRGGRTIDEQYARALEFARDRYVPALIQGAALSAEQRHQVALEMSGLIGLPADKIEAADLRIDRLSFMQSLLAARGLRTGQLDGRATRAIAKSQLRPPFDDPSMSLGTQSGTLIADYLHDELGYTLPSPYRSLNLGINFKWSWADYGGSYAAAAFAPYAAAAMEANPRLKLFTAGGYYDITTPVFAGEFALDQAGAPHDRRTTKFYPAGHSIFEDESQLAALSHDLHAFLAGITSATESKLR